MTAYTTVYELPLLPNNAGSKEFYKNPERCKCLVNIYYWGSGLVVNGRIRDTVQKVVFNPPSKPPTQMSKSETDEHLILSTGAVLVL